MTVIFFSVVINKKELQTVAYTFDKLYLLAIFFTNEKKFSKKLQFKSALSKSGCFQTPSSRSVIIMP